MAHVPSRIFLQNRKVRFPCTANSEAYLIDISVHEICLSHKTFNYFIRTTPAI